MSLTCFSCDQWRYSTREGLAPQMVGCKLHGLVEMRLLTDCADASYEPGLDFQFLQNDEDEV